jgi:hypothetical protein
MKSEPGVAKVPVDRPCEPAGWAWPPMTVRGVADRGCFGAGVTISRYDRRTRVGYPARPVFYTQN